MSEVEETFKRIQGHKGVIGIIVVNSEGIPIRTTLDNSTTVQYASLLHQLSAKARSTVRDIDPTNDLTFLRIRTKKFEIMIAPVAIKVTQREFENTGLQPGESEQYQLFVIQKVSNK